MDIKKIIDHLKEYLPDTYDKSDDSNLSKLIKIFRNELKEINKMKEDLADQKDVDKAENIYLDRIGANIGQPRGSFNDDQYRALIKSKIQQNLSPGDINNLLDYISTILQISRSDVALYQGFTSNFEKLWGENQSAALLIEMPYFEFFAGLPYSVIENLVAAGVAVRWLIIFDNRNLIFVSSRFNGQSDTFHFAGQLYSKPIETATNKGLIKKHGPIIKYKYMYGWHEHFNCGDFYSGDNPIKSSGFLNNNNALIEIRKLNGYSKYNYCGTFNSGEVA